MPTATTAATFDTFDALQLVPSAANATVAAKPPRNVHEHAAALGAPLLRSDDGEAFWIEFPSATAFGGQSFFVSADSKRAITEAAKAGGCLAPLSALSGPLLSRP